MKNILIPTDFSKNSWNAIEYALKFFENSCCNFYLLHVNTINTLVNGVYSVSAIGNSTKQVFKYNDNLSSWTQNIYSNVYLSI